MHATPIQRVLPLSSIQRLLASDMVMTITRIAVVVCVRTAVLYYVHGATDLSSDNLC